MVFLLASLGLFLAGGGAALALGRGQSASRIGAFSAVAASLIGVVPAFLLLADSLTVQAPPLSLTVGKLPMGELALRLDLLSALFLVPVLLLVAVAAVHGMGGGDGSGAQADQGHAGGHAGAHWFFYNLLAGGMVLTLTAADAFLFLLAWEVMSLAPFFLITLNDTSAETHSAAWTYLVAAHLGALFLLAFFALLAAKNDSLSFAAFAAGAAGLEPGIRGGAGLLFVLALIGFGAKTGFMPLHVWLPEAHPAAPSHVSAVMSGAMIKMGVYGIIRTFAFLGIGEAWWAYTLILVGLFTAAAGILQALAQSAIKRSLAFSSVENMGIICLGFGIALLCLQNNHAGAAALAATGALVHMVNHTLTKGLLFLCAGCVLHGAGTVTLRLLGGLQKRMPVVGWCFVLGSASIAALPPLNGFAGEFFLYLGMVFGGTASASGPSPEYSLLFWVCLFILAAVGGFTLLCFSRLYGMAFLGAPRTEAAARAHNPARNEIAAVCILAALCALSAAAAPRVAKLGSLAVSPAFLAAHVEAPAQTAAKAQGPVFSAARLSSLPEGVIPPRLASGPDYPDGPDSAIALLGKVNAVFLLLVTAVLAAFLFRRGCLRERTIGASPTWDCGYLAPTARMQYTAGSFSQSAAFLLRTILRQKFSLPSITEYFPLRVRASVATPDWIETRGIAPLFTLVSRIADKCKDLQHGRANGYILYILVTLVALLAWKLE
jgi:hydrogenase-4 component B